MLEQVWSMTTKALVLEACKHCGHDREAHILPHDPDGGILNGPEHCLDCWRDNGPGNDLCEFEPVESRRCEERRRTIDLGLANVRAELA
jgi:hypothetical protein